MLRMTSDATTEVVQVRGADLRVERLAQGMTIRQLAEKSGVNRFLISRIERGISTGTGAPKALPAIAEALGVDHRKYLVVKRAA